MSESRPFKVFSGTKSRYLAERICQSLGCPLGNMTITHFADGEFGVSFEESIRGVDVFLVQSTFPSCDNLMELLLMIDAAKRASAHSIIAVIPYFGWARHCATQNELNEEAAKALVANGCIAVAEGANMPSTPGAIKVFQDAKILYSPGKASNAGGVSVSGLEMSQNSERLSWSAEEVDAKLLWIMENIHENCVKYGTEPDGYINYVKGANVAGFMKVAKAMMAQGIV